MLDPIRPAGRPRPPSSALMVCGTTSNAGKSTVVAGLCRVLARQGVRVAPFKAQNMSNNSAVTPSGHEIGRAQAWQAAAARVTAEVAMNPVLLKPTTDRTSQVVVLGRPIGVADAADYHDRKPELFDIALNALADLRSRFDAVILEGAGSPAEINLFDRDIVNLRLAARASIPAVVVGDIELGGVFAALYGTIALLPEDQRALVKGFVINKFRGERALLFDGTDQLFDRCGVPTLGVLPWIPGSSFDGEDSLTIGQLASAGAEHDRGRPPGDVLDVAVLHLPHIANFTDCDPLVAEPGVRVRFVHDRAELGRPDLLVVPGSKATLADLAWVRARGLDRAITEAAAARTTVFGICAGYQMLGRSIEDRRGVEGEVGARVPGLGLLGVHTEFVAEKTTRCVTGTALGRPINGYQIHHGRVVVDEGDVWLSLRCPVAATDVDELVPEGLTRGTVAGTTVHGLFEPDEFRRVLLTTVADRAGKQFVAGSSGFEELRQARIDRVADAIEAHVDLDTLLEIAGSAKAAAP